MPRFAGPLSALLITAMPADGQGTTAAQLRELDAYITNGLRGWEIPGLTVTIVRNDSVLLTKGYGVRRLGASDAVAAQTEVGIMGTTKAIAAPAMGMLVDDGKSSWNDPITTHCPALQLQDPILTREATEKDLLTHYIGMGNADLLRARGDLTALEILRRVRYLPAAYSLRGGFACPNVRFGAAGQLIARVL